MLITISVCRDSNEDGEIEDNDAKSQKKVPLSLEELLTKKKAEEEAQSKVNCGVRCTNSWLH